MKSWTIRGYQITAKMIAIAVAVVLLIAGVGFTVRSCDARHSKTAQSRVDQGQQGAATNSSVDAINTVTGVGANTAASEDLGRTNERDIRAAEGAGNKVGAAGQAGISALCKRQAYRNDPRCKGTTR